ncbi:hypothetical protein BaRGS_00016225 [Batillaria attramentaria]|uniref:Uncharacterized protein n=1 Tax=Batillaria attramentaria TaxID=370345 RepID=A0ABD0KZF5_9CAEN
MYSTSNGHQFTGQVFGGCIHLPGTQAEKKIELQVKMAAKRPQQRRKRATSDKRNMGPKRDAAKEHANDSEKVTEYVGHQQPQWARKAEKKIMTKLQDITDQP